MTKEIKHTLTLDRLATYQIKVPGTINMSHVDWNSAMVISEEKEGDGPPVTTMTGDFDQAALHGLLRRLYYLGLPLISVFLVDGG